MATLIGVSGIEAAQSPTHWVGTWATAPMAVPNKSGKFGAESAEGTTLREIVHVSLGGSAVRVVLTNEFGEQPLTIRAAQVALSDGSSNIKNNSSTALTFSGNSSITIPPGARVVSDPAAIKLAPLTDLAISLFLPTQPLSQFSLHKVADQTNYMESGNAVTSTSLQDAKPFFSWEFLKAVEVSAEPDAAAIVALGDSITDGYRITLDSNRRWPDQLARRLQAEKKTSRLGVLNLGISGNRVLHDGPNGGPGALTRFDRDVLAQASVKYLVLLEAINDIGRAYDPKNPQDVVSADDLIEGYQQILTRAHLHGIKVYIATLTPCKGTGGGYGSSAGEEVRQKLNAWIRTSKEPDGFIDFDKATRDANAPDRFAAAYDSGDHLHPNDAGAKAMADAIDLTLFTR